MQTPRVPLTMMSAGCERSSTAFSLRRSEAVYTILHEYMHTNTRMLITFTALMK